MDQGLDDKYPEAKVEFREKFDKAISEYMREHHISQGAVYISRGDEVLIHQGYGTAPDTLFRIASITKPITRSAIKTLISKDLISLDTKAFPLIGLAPIEGEQVNPQLEQITIEQLLNHKAGWDISVIGYDPTSEGLNPNESIQLMLHKPLQFEPGTKSVYSNLGYVVLGRVIEKISGQSYEQFIRERLMEPLGITSIKVGSPKKGGEGNEAIYEDDKYDPYEMNIEAFDSAGGLISTAQDLCKFMKAYWITGDQRKKDEEQFKMVSFGGIQGTKAVAIQRTDGINAVVLFNRRDRENSNDHDELVTLVESLIYS